MSDDGFVDKPMAIDDVTKFSQSEKPRNSSMWLEMRSGILGQLFPKDDAKTGAVGIIGSMGDMDMWRDKTKAVLAPVQDATPAKSSEKADPDAANGGDPILTTLIQAIQAPPMSQLPSQYSGGRVYVQGGSSGHPAVLWIALAIAAGVGVWYFKKKGGNA